jgi:hypothetical protein
MHTSQADATLNEIERVLEDERVALRTLDVAVIERTTNDKARLDRQLSELAETGSFEPRHKDRIQAIRDSAVHNQLLLAHARSCVRAGLAAATGAEPAGYAKPTSQPPAPAATPVRVDVRG